MPFFSSSMFFLSALIAIILLPHQIPANTHRPVPLLPHSPLPSMPMVLCQGSLLSEDTFRGPCSLLTSGHLEGQTQA